MKRAARAETRQDMRRIRTFTTLVAFITAVTMSSCGGNDAAAEAGQADENQPTIVVTTGILGDVVTELVGDQANVLTIMGTGVDPHDFQPSAQEINQMTEADALIANGGGFEEGLLDAIGTARAEGVPTFEALDSVETIEFGEAGGHHDHDHEGEEGHDDDHEDHEDEGEEDHDEDHEDEEEGHEDEGDDDHEDDHDHGHSHEGVDPHFFTDPNRMADAVRAIDEFLHTEVEGIDQELLDTAVESYLSDLDALDADVVQLVDAIPTERRILVTNHEVFGYFADRYGFEIVGTVIPGGTTIASASAGELADLAETIEEEGVPAIFADSSASTDLADALAAEVGDVAVVQLLSESLGEPGSEGSTYLDMIRTNATRMSEALSG